MAQPKKLTLTQNQDWTQLEAAGVVQDVTIQCLDGPIEFMSKTSGPEDSDIGIVIYPRAAERHIIPDSGETVYARPYRPHATLDGTTVAGSTRIRCLGNPL